LEFAADELVPREAKTATALSKIATTIRVVVVEFLTR
jgi:hypothetical protein